MPGYHRLSLPEIYRALTSLGKRDFAWEWLRRNPDFRAQWTSAGAAHAASARAEEAVRRSRRPVTDVPIHPEARRWTHWGISFLRFT